MSEDKKNSRRGNDISCKNLDSVAKRLGCASRLGSGSWRWHAERQSMLGSARVHGVWALPPQKRSRISLGARGLQRELLNIRPSNHSLDHCPQNKELVRPVFEGMVNPTCREDGARGLSLLSSAGPLSLAWHNDHVAHLPPAYPFQQSSILVRWYLAGNILSTSGT